MFAYKKSQLASIDLVISITAILLTLSIAIALILWSYQSEDASSKQSVVIFSNLERMENASFIAHYRFNKTALETFKALGETQKEKLFEGTPYKSSDGACFFFQESGSLNNTNIMGTASCDITSPCDDTKEILVFSKPALKDGKIGKASILVCRP